MNTVAYQSFMEYCRTKANQVLPTISGNAEFKLTSVQDECLHLTIISTGKQRHSKKNWIQKYLAYYNETNSLRPTDYNKNIHCTNASYILTLIKLYVAAKKIVE